MPLLKGALCGYGYGYGYGYLSLKLITLSNYPKADQHNNAGGLSAV